MNKKEFTDAILNLRQVPEGTWLWASPLNVKVMASKQKNNDIVVKVVGTTEVDLEKIWQSDKVFAQFSITEHQSAWSIGRAFKTIQRIEDTIKETYNEKLST